MAGEQDYDQELSQLDFLAEKVAGLIKQMHGDACVDADAWLRLAQTEVPAIAKTLATIREARQGDQLKTPEPMDSGALRIANVIRNEMLLGKIIIENAPQAVEQLLEEYSDSVLTERVGTELQDRLKALIAGAKHHAAEVNELHERNRRLQLENEALETIRNFVLATIKASASALASDSKSASRNK